MLPIRTRSVFKSRWIALLWAGGILWSAVEFAGGQPAPNATGNGGADGAADMQEAVGMLNAIQ